MGSHENKLNMSAAHDVAIDTRRTVVSPSSARCHYCAGSGVFFAFSFLLLARGPAHRRFAGWLLGVVSSNRRSSVDLHERAAGRWAVSSFLARLRSLTVPAAAVYRQEPPTLEIVDEQKSSHSRLALRPR
jgi:hypothetical protein